MGADAVIQFYGIRLRVPRDDKDAIAGLEARTDPRLVAARDVRLDSWWGRLTDGADFHLLIGKRLGVFGSENDAEKQMTLQELSTLAARPGYAIERWRLCRNRLTCVSIRGAV